MYSSSEFSPAQCPKWMRLPFEKLMVERAVVGAKLGVYHPEHRLYVVRLELGVGAAEDEDADAGVVIGAEQGLGAHGPGLAAALRAPVGGVELAGGEEQLLLGVGLAGVPDIFSRHSAAPLPTPSSLMTRRFSAPAPALSA